MKKLFISLFFCLFSFCSVAQTELIVLKDVVDGDTIRAEIIGFPEPLNRVSIRILGIDTPEMKGKCEKEKKNARLAKKFIEDQLKITHVVSFDGLKWDKYGGRILANVFFDGYNLSELLIQNGYAIPYHGEKKTHDWCL